MTIAQEFLNEFNSIEIYESISGKVWVDRDQLAAFRKKAFATAATKINNCPQSSDPSYTLIFEDGSKLHLANPWQDAFKAFAYVKE